MAEFESNQLIDTRFHGRRCQLDVFMSQGRLDRPAGQKLVTTPLHTRYAIYLTRTNSRVNSWSDILSIMYLSRHCSNMYDIYQANNECLKKKI